MPPQRRRLLWLPMALALACGAAGDADVHYGDGVVRSVERDEAALLVEHDDIPGLMPAMTMSFDVADPALLDGVEPGQPIRFGLARAERGYRIVSLELVGEAGRSGGGGFQDLAASADPAPAFQLTDQEGRSVSLADLAGKLVVLDFIFTRCPGPCPILTGIQVDAQRALEDPLRERTHFVSITLDPEYDEPGALKGYALARGADLDGWSFLTGDPAEVEAVIASYGIGTLRGGDGEIQHIVATFVIDGDGQIRERLIGLDHGPEDVVRALERASADAQG